AEDGIRAFHVTGVQTCALPISRYDCAVELVSPRRAGAALSPFHDVQDGAVLYVAAYRGGEILRSWGEQRLLRRQVVGPLQDHVGRRRGRERGVVSAPSRHPARVLHDDGAVEGVAGEV